MPDLPFVAKGITDVLTGQEKMRIGAQALKDLYKQQNLEMAGAANAARSAVAGTLTAMERIEKKIADVRAGLSKGVIDPAKGEETLRRLQKKLDDVKKSSDDAGRGLAKAFGNEALGYLARWAGPAGIIAGALGVVTSEMRSQLALIDRKAELKMGVSASRNVMLRNLPDMDEATKLAILKENQDLASEVGVSETVINAARADAYAASGGNRKASLEAVRGSAKYLFDRPQDISSYSGALLDFSNVTGTDRWDVNLGLLEQVGGMSRVTDPRQQAMNIAPALIGATGFGLETAEAGAMYAMLTTKSGDITGASGGTATIQLAKELRDFREELLKKPQAGLLSKEGFERLRAIENLPAGQKLTALQGDAELSKAFMRGVEGEARFRSQIENLTMSPTSEEARRYAAFRDQIGSDEKLARGGQAAVAGLEANKLNRQSRFEQGLVSTNEQLALLDPTPNLTTQARTSLLEQLQLAGEISTVATARSVAARMSDNSIGLSLGEAENLIKPVIEDLRDGVEGTATMGGYIRGRVASDTELRIADLLQQQLNLLKESNAEQKVQTQKIGAAQIPTR